jgi:hypothetical protein
MTEYGEASSLTVGGAAQQGVEADEAWLTSELRSLTPVFDGLPIEH